MSIIAKEISTKQFTFVKKTGNFIGEVSDFSYDVLNNPIYDDACDVGFMLVSEKTGDKILYSLYSTDYLYGELVSWTFTPCRLNKNNLHLAGMKVVIYND